MSRLQALSLAALVGVVFQPMSGLDCSPRGIERLPCCSGSDAGCHQIGEAAACCQELPSGADSGSAVAAASTSRPLDDVGMASTPASLPSPPVVAAGFAAYVRSNAPSPPRRPAVLRL
jgi:hypothetical protein